MDLVGNSISYLGHVYMLPLSRPIDSGLSQVPQTPLIKLSLTEEAIALAVALCVQVVRRARQMIRVKRGFPR